MRQPNRTLKCRDLLPILYPSRLSSTISCPTPPSKQHRNPLPINTSICPSPTTHVLRRQTMVSRLSTSLPSENTSIRSPPLAPQSTRRSPYCRFNGPCSRTSKTRGLRDNANDDYTRTPYQRTQLPLYCLCPLRSHYNRLNLSPPNRSKISNRILIRKPHRTSSRGHSNPNTLRLYGGPHPHDCPRTYLLRSFLLSQY